MKPSAHQARRRYRCSRLPLYYGVVVIGSGTQRLTPLMKRIQN